MNVYGLRVLQWLFERLYVPFIMHSEVCTVVDVFVSDISANKRVLQGFPH